MPDTPRICLLKSTYERLKESIITLLPGEICLVDTEGTGYDSLVVGDGKTKAKDLNLIPLNVSKGAVFLGVANKETNPGKPNQCVFYITSDSGKFPGFDGITIEKESISLLRWNTKNWEVIKLFKIDEKFDEESCNPIQNKIVTKKFNDLENEVIKVITVNGVELQRIGNTINLVVDDTLSEISKNPIMNKAVTTKINEFGWYEGE